MFDEDYELIFSYTRAQALEDGTLIDVTEQARQEGFIVPVALTAAAWVACVEWPADNLVQQEDARLRDVLLMARLAARIGEDKPSVPVRVSVLNYHTQRQQEVRLIMTIGPGDTPSPVITLMLPGED